MSVLRICTFWAVNCAKMRLAAGLRPDPLGSSSTPQPPSCYKVMGGREREEKGWE